LKPTRFIAGGLLLACLLGLFFLLRLKSDEGQHEGQGEARTRAARRGLHFIIDIAHDPKVFEKYGGDLLWCLYSIASTSADRELSQVAWTAAIERAREYRRLNPAPPNNAGPDEISTLAAGSYSADMIGVHDEAMKEQIRRAAARFSPQDFLWYDPRKEPPPSDVPDECERCGFVNSRGAKICRQCGARLKMQSRYDIWLDSLIVTFNGDHYGVILGARYSDVLRWAPIMRPYRLRSGNPEFLKMVYAATHVVYTLNEYSKYRISSLCLPDEFQFLKASLHESIAMKDPETAGEFLDSLRAFGLTESDPGIGAAIDYLLHTQNPDGSWGDETTKSSYGRYHPTWTAIDGLREYRWTDELCPRGQD
jgi:hypothetical protein